MYSLAWKVQNSKFRPLICSLCNSFPETAIGQPLIMLGLISIARLKVGTLSLCLPRKGIQAHMKGCATTPTANLKTMKDMPGLSRLPVIGILHHFLPVIGSIGPVENFFKMSGVFHERYGNIVKMEGFFARSDMVILYDPEHYDQVYRAEEDNPLRPGFETLVYYRTVMRKSYYNGVYGLTTAQGPQWREFRTKVNPALLKPKLVKLYAKVLDDIALDVVVRLKKFESNDSHIQTNFYNEMARFSLEAIGYVSLGSRLGCLQDDLPEDHPALRLLTSVRNVLDKAFAMEAGPAIWKIIPTKSFKQITEAFDTQWEISKMFIDEAKANIQKRGKDIPEEDKSIIEKLLAIDEKVATTMANEMLMAGIDTVAFVTVGLLYQLAKNQNVQEKLREEIRSGVPNRRYLKACIKESLRIWPVIPANLRRTTKEHVVGDYLIPKGVEVISPNEYLSKLEKHYPRALKFLPERWLADKSDPLYYGNTHPMITQPFGYGVRTCIGRRIAELEIESLIVCLIDKFNITWNGPPIKVQTKIMNMFEGPFYFKLNYLK